MKLSERLKAVAAMVPPKSRLGDVGADRGELSYDLLEKEKVKYVILSDISPRSLQRAKDLFSTSPFQDKAEFRVGSGFTVLKAEEVDCVVLAGMGGDTIVSIFKEAPEITQAMPTIIVQAMGKSHYVRKFFMENRFQIVAETMVFEDDHYYTIIKAEQGTMVLSEKEIYGGKSLIAEKNCFLKGALAREKTELTNILAKLTEKNLGKERQKEIRKHIGFIEEIEEDMA